MVLVLGIPQVAAADLSAEDTFTFEIEYNNPTDQEQTSYVIVQVEPSTNLQDTDIINATDGLEVISIEEFYESRSGRMIPIDEAINTENLEEEGVLDIQLTPGLGFYTEGDEDGCQEYTDRDGGCNWDLAYENLLVEGDADINESNTNKLPAGASGKYGITLGLKNDVKYDGLHLYSLGAMSVFPTNAKINEQTEVSFTADYGAIDEEVDVTTPGIGDARVLNGITAKQDAENVLKWDFSPILASDFDGDAEYSYQWDFGDDSFESVSPTTNPSEVRQTYFKDGEYTVKLTMTDEDGVDYKTTKTISIVEEVVEEEEVAGATVLTMTELKTLTVSCTDVIVNAASTCKFTLPANKTLPTDLKLSLGDVAVGGACVATGSAVTCNGVPTSTVIGVHSVYASTAGAKDMLTATANVVAPAEDLVTTGAETNVLIVVFSMLVLTGLFATGVIVRRLQTLDY